MELIDYMGNKIQTGDCPACDFAEKKVSLPCGTVYEDDKISIMQDWELPIDGFIVVSPNRHIEFVQELSAKERNHMFKYVTKCLKALRGEIGICDEYNVIFEEKRNRHFHIWLMPRHEWMKQFGTTKNIGAIQNYAKEHLRTKEEFDKIDKTVKKLREILSRDKEKSCLQK